MSALHRLIYPILSEDHFQSHINLMTTECGQVPSSSVYVMINTDEVPNQLENMVDIFYLFDSIRYIVGYCLPFKCYVENFGNAEPCRIIKATENIQLYHEHITRFKVIYCKKKFLRLLVLLFKKFMKQ